MISTRRGFLGSALGMAVATTTTGMIGQQALAAPAPSRPPPGEPLTVRTPDGLQLSAMAYGNPAHPELLFAHGLGQSRLAWDRQVSALSDRFRIVTFDLRGHGDSSKPDHPDAYADGASWAGDLQAVMRAAKLQHPTLVGWSFGGFTLGHYLKHHGAGQVNGVVLVAAVTRFSSELFWPSTLALGEKLTSPLLETRVLGIEESLRRSFAQRPSEEEFKRMLTYNAMVPRALQLGYGRIGSDGVDQAWGLPRRMLVVAGARDGILRPQMATRMLALNDNTRLSTFENAGHAPHYEDAARFNRELVQFLAS